MPRTANHEVAIIDGRDNDRNYIMARLAAAQVSLRAATQAVDDCLALWVNADEDKKGSERRELVDTALEATGCATRALVCADEMLAEADRETLALLEPWEYGDDEDEDDTD